MTATRIIRAFAALSLALAAVATPAAAVAASEFVVARTAGTPVHAAAEADVDDFSYASWDATYEVGIDEDGRARMRVTETLVARFPDFDQNRGIVRGLPTTYEGAGIDTRVLSVTDENGADVPYETEEEDGLLLVLTGNDDFVQGLTTYVIEYEMRDVILAAEASSDSSTRQSARGQGEGNPAVDEFYWDLLPLDSTQPIERFRADIVFDAAMSDRLTGSARCYTGASGSTAECELQGPVVDGDAAAFRVESGERAAGDGVTVAIGFARGTVVQPSARMPNPVTDTAPLAAAIGAAGLSVGAWVTVAAFQRRRRTATGVIVAQYDVPDSMPPLLAAALLPGAKDVIPAEIVHLAVRGTLRIEEGTSPEQPRLRRIAGVRIPDQLDVEALDALFLKADEGGCRRRAERQRGFRHADGRPRAGREDRGEDPRSHDQGAQPRGGDRAVDRDRDRRRRDGAERVGRRLRSAVRRPRSRRHLVRTRPRARRELLLLREAHGADRRGRQGVRVSEGRRGVHPRRRRRPSAHAAVLHGSGAPTGRYRRRDPRVRAAPPLRDAVRHGEGMGRRARDRLRPRAAWPRVDR